MKVSRERFTVMLHWNLKFILSMFLWNITETFRECTVVMLILELKMYIPEMFVTVSCTVGVQCFLTYGTTQQ